MEFPESKVYLAMITQSRAVRCFVGKNTELDE